MSASESRPVVTFDWTEFERPSTAVVSVVAEASDTDVLTMEPIYESVDPDSLDDLFAPASNSPGVPTGSVRFEYHDYSVVVNANGRGYLYGRDGGRRSPTEPFEIGDD